MTESSGKRSSVWATLVKVDDGGNARAVRWETLANLVPSKAKGTQAHPARLQAAESASAQVAQSTLAEHRKIRGDWFAQARKDLNNLPLEIADSIEDREERIELRQQLQQQTAHRLEQLQQLAQVELTPPRLVGRLRVLPAATPELAEAAKSEWIAMKYVQQFLEADGWHVEDVHTEGRGYDLEARRHSQVRQVEVKGVAGDASSVGIRMTGNEVLIATQHRTSYWLYVVDQCADGAGRLFGAYEDPATLFSSDMVGDAIFRVPGSSLKNAPGSTQ
jgi:hypothetical protein